MQTIFLDLILIMTPQFSMNNKPVVFYQIVAILVRRTGLEKDVIRLILIRYFKWLRRISNLFYFIPMSYFKIVPDESQSDNYTEREKRRAAKFWKYNKKVRKNVAKKEAFYRLRKQLKNDLE